MSCQAPPSAPVHQARQVLIAPAGLSVQVKATILATEVTRTPRETPSFGALQGTSGTQVKPPGVVPANAENDGLQISAKELKSFRRIRKDPEPE